MRPIRFLHALALPARRALGKLGSDLKDARLRRRLSTTLVAERAFLNRKTLRKIEMGNAGVSMGAYASVLFVVGMTDRLADVADSRFDRTGLTLEEERLPKRIRATKKGPSRARR
jgi:transcriptional regulator with XRE-family HTH domain